MTRSHHHPEHGFSLVEIAFGLVIFAIAAVVLINHLSVNYSATRLQTDRVFAFTKAQALLAEVQAYVDRGEAAAAIDLDVLDDGVTDKWPLTISKEGGNLVPADHPLSGNTQRDGQWVWSRRITVRPFLGLNNRNVRYVTVRISRHDTRGVPHQLAEISSVVHSVGSAFPTTQVFDLYLLAVENIPGWWVYMESIRPFFESTLSDLQSRNPGLEIRTHWITKSGYGRNQWYTPLINEAYASTTSIPNVYYYPGLMPPANSSTYYYVPGAMSGRMSYDGTVQHGYDADTNPYPYALADWFNHAMRYPQEKALHDKRVAATAARRVAIETARRNSTPLPAAMDDPSEEPTLRLLLEDMCTDPNKYRRAMLVNLHGELLPMPSLRNYSDAAKDPEYLPEVRVVTHPEELRTRRTTAAIDDVYLRVYAYVTSPDHFTGSTTMPDSRPIAIKVKNLDLTDGTGGLFPGVEVQRLAGGVTVGGDNRYYGFTSTTAGRLGQAPTKATAAYANEMSYTAQYVDPGAGQEKFTLIKLYHTPVVAPAVSTKGLGSSTRSRLYGLEYIPSCCEATGDFSRDLNYAADVPKNTARWRVKIPSTVFGQTRFVTTSNTYHNPNANVVVTVQTSIWDEAKSQQENLQFGQVNPAPSDPTLFRPDNLSETYTWWADTAAAVPMTERYQYQGDPRHNPYRDNLASSTTPDFLDGYNWNFDSLNNSSQNAAADFPALNSAALRNHWLGRQSQDLPRFFQLLRTGLINTGSVYTTLTGFSYYYVGFGNEIGYDSSNGYTSSIPTNLRPWGAPTTNSTVDDITNDVGDANAHRGFVRSAANYWGTYFWWGMTWLGELCPDAMWTSQWKPRGNLNAGSGAADFYRRSGDTLYTAAGNRNRAYGTAFALSAQRSNAEGCTSFFDIGTSTSTFHHQFSSSTGNLIESGPELAANYNFPMPGTASITRPFRLNTDTAGGLGSEMTYAPYTTTEHGTATILRRYYDHTSGATGSGVVQFFDNSGAKSCFVVVNGLAATVESGSSFIAKYSLLTLVQTFLEGGNASLTSAHRIKQPPRLSIVAPTEITEIVNPVTIPIQVQIDWVRWDGLKYTTSTAASFAESESELQYVFLYSRDGGITWLQVEDDSVATPGAKPTGASYLHNDTGTGNETLIWNVPAASFPKGSYLIRAEVYRNNQSLHYSYHQAKIYVSR